MDTGMLLPLLQAMTKNQNGNYNQIETLLKTMGGMGNQGAGSPNTANPGNTSANNSANPRMNDMMQMLPLLMQMMNKGGNNTSGPSPEPTINETPPKDPFEPIRNIGNDNINSILYNLMNRN